MYVLGTHATFTQQAMASSHNHKRWPHKIHTCAARGQVIGLSWCPSEGLFQSLEVLTFSQDAGGAEADLHSRAQ